MDTTPKQQILRALKDSKKILLLSHKNVDGDGLSSMIALYLVLKKLGKEVTAYTPDPVPSALNFLPNIKDYLSHKIDSFNDFIITLDCSNAKVEKLKYTIVDNKVNIIITPKDGNFDPSDISTVTGGVQYDTIITLDTGDMDHLGGIYKENPNLFHSAIVVNVDHHVTNTFYGTSNLVDPKATSTCEIILSLIEALESQYGTKLLNKDIATYLLTGITVDTNSFQNANTTPKAFSVSAQLLGLGADQQTIIKNLYKTHTLSKLKLWGRALSNIREDKEHKLVWSVLSKHDFEQTHASEGEVEGLIDELMTSAPGADLVFLLKENIDGQISCSIRSLGTSDAGKLAVLFNGGGHKKAAGFRIKGDSLEKVENYVVKKFRDYKMGLLDLPSEDSKRVELEKNIPYQKEAEQFIQKVQEESQKRDIPYTPHIEKPSIPTPPVPERPRFTPTPPVIDASQPRIPEPPKFPDTPSRPEIRRPGF